MSDFWQAQPPSSAGSRKTRRGASKRPQRHVEAKAKPSSGQHKPRRDYKAELVQQCGIVGLKLEPEFKFLADRQFRADWRVHYAIKGGFKGGIGIVHVPSSVLIEYEGGIFSSGKRGHSSVSGIRRDIEKSNLAQIAGYTIIRVAPDHVVSGRALDWIMDALRTEKICVKCGLRQGVPPTDRDF